MNSGAANVVHGMGGWEGILWETGLHPGGTVEIEVPGGQRLRVQSDWLQEREDGSYYLPLSLESKGQRSGVVVPVVAEQLQVDKVEQETGRVAVYIRPEEEKKVVEVEVGQEEVEVERRAVNRVVERAEPPRQEGDVTIVPVYEERLVMEKRLVLKEEIHLRRRHTSRTERREVSLRREQAQVLRARTEPEK